LVFILFENTIEIKTPKPLSHDLMALYKAVYYYYYYNLLSFETIMY